jgi:cell division transport system permease protein
MNWAAISTVTVLLFLLGMGLQLSWQVDQVLHQVGNQMEVSAYLKPGVDARSLEPLVRQFPQIAGVEVVSKDQAWRALIQDLGASNLQGVTQGLTDNPLVDELRVKATDSNQVPELARQLAQLQGIDEVHFLDEALRHLTQLQRSLGQIGLGVVSLLALTTIAVISTTVRLIVLSRSQEIEIMQLVGATSTWIYSPFLLQGVGFGLAGAVAALAGLLASQQVLSRVLAQQPELLRLLMTGISGSHLLLLPLCLLGLGSVVGVVGSFLAVRRLVWR